VTEGRGYWDRNARLRAWADESGVERHFVHSGGHVWPEDLDRLVSAVQPVDPVVWVHTDAFSLRHS
jgi:hypothetical protein